MSGVTVRPFRTSDEAELARIYLELYDERDAGAAVGITLFTTRPAPDDEAAWYAHQRQRIDAGDLVYLVAEVGGKVVGSCTIGRVGPTASAEDGHVAELGILVAQEMRGKGVGSALLERALTEARGKFEIVFLSVFSFNRGAQRLYERFGFSLCGHLPRVVKRGDQYLDEERMVRDLSQSAPGGGANR